MHAFSIIIIRLEVLRRQIVGTHNVQMQSWPCNCMSVGLSLIPLSTTPLKNYKTEIPTYLSSDIMISERFYMLHPQVS